MPVGKSEPSSIINYNHGTISKRTQVPSTNPSEERRLGIAIGSFGFLSVVPDYLGLGESDFPYHPYIHAKTEATSAIDLLRVAKKLSTRENLSLSGKLYLVGYSQGGHATMATHRELQLNHADEFTVTASAPLAGPHDLSGVQADMIASDQEYAVPSYLPFLLIGYNNIYNMYPNLADAVKPEYMETVIPMFNGEYTTGEIDKVMPKVPKQIIKDEVLQNYINNPNHVLRKRLLENDTWRGWTPKAPIYMSHCESDEEVNHLNSAVARQKFIEQGMNPADITVISPSNSVSHYECAPLSILLAYSWMKSFE
jgi:hypothetical protein